MNKFEATFWRNFLGGVTAATIASVSFAAAAQPVNTVLATVPLPSSVPLGIAVTPDNLYVYVVGNGANALFRLDAQTNSFVGNAIGLGGDSEFVAVSPNGKKALVVNSVSPYDGINSAPGTVTLIDNASTNTPAFQMTIPGMGQLAYGIAINPEGTRAWITNTYNADVTVIDLKNNRVMPVPIQCGDGPNALVFTPDGKSAYVTAEFDANIVEINTKTLLMVGDPIHVGFDPRGIVVTPDGKKVYVANADGTVSVIDTATHKVTSTINLNANNGAYALGCAITPDGKYVYVPNQSARTVVVISTLTDTVVGDPVSVGNTPGLIAIAPNGKRAYVTNLFDNSVSIIQITGA
jgi:YVTN family beta-propeller protein